MKPSGLLSAALVLVATNSSTKALAAPVSSASQGLPRHASNEFVAAPAHRSDQAPIIDHASIASTASVSFDAPKVASTSTHPGAEPEEDLVETIVDDVEARRREIEDLVLSIKASRVRDSLLEEDYELKVRYEDLPDRPIDDPTRWMAARELGKS